MNRSLRYIVVSVFGIVALLMLLSETNLSTKNSLLFAVAAFKPLASPTPVSNIAVNTNSATDSPTPSPPPTVGDSKFPKTFTLAQDSQSDEGAVAFDHEAHAFGNRSPDGKSVMGCVECHHTEQPKSALKPPLFTSERDSVLTLDLWKTTTQKVSECRACHFQKDNVPAGKKMPTSTFEQGGKTKVKEVTNQLAFHVNCNTCHDAAAKARPELKTKPGFATKNDCAKCHKSN